MDGIIIINKNKGCTSNNIVNDVKRILNTKVGHIGTLDPNATGVLPLLLGKATKFSKYLINHDKKYMATLKLGIKTSTADIEGHIIEKKDVENRIFENYYLKNILDTFIGIQKQMPPMYSAIKIKGKKLYEYARKGLEIEVPNRTIEIYDIKLVNFDIQNKEIKFMVHCSKGTYIRSLCEDIAIKLNTVGYMSDLERLMVGDFLIENSVTVEELKKNNKKNEWLSKNIITLEDLLKENLKIKLPDSEVNKFMNGVGLITEMDEGIYSVYKGDQLLGSAVVKEGRLKRDIIIVDK